jgi:hypothetical protein
LAFGISKGAVFGSLSEGEAAARGGDGSAEFFGGFDPFLNDDFDVGECEDRRNVGREAGEAGDRRDVLSCGLEEVANHRIVGTFARLNVGTSGERQDVGEWRAKMIREEVASEGIVRRLEG